MTSDWLIDLHSAIFFEFFIPKDNSVRIDEFAAIPILLPSKFLIEYILAGKTLLDYTNLFFQNDYKKNDKITYKYFKDKYGRRN